MHLSPVVIVVLVSVAGFILLYLLARKIKPLGHSIAVVCAVVGSLLVTLSYHMNAAAAYCKKVCHASLKSINDTGEFSMLDFLWRLSGFDIGSLILLGESIQVTEVLPSLFQAATVSLPPIAELSSAALFLCCSALFGDIVLECWGKIRGVGLFHNMGKPSRWIVGSLSMLLLIFSVLVNGYFYIFRAEILAHKNTSGMTVYILGGLGLEVSAVAPFALLAIKEGSPAVIALLLWFAEKSFEAMHAGATFVPDLLDTIALHLSGGEIGVYGKQIERDPYKYPPHQAGRSLASHLGQTNVVELPEYAASIDAGTDIEIVPALTLALEEKMSKHPDCNASLVFVGSYASKVRPYVLRKLDDLQAKGSILSSGYVDLSINHIPTAIPGIVDISPTVAERQAATMHGRNEDEIYTTLLHLLDGRLVETHRHTRAAPGSFTFIVDPYKLVDFADVAESIKHRYPLHSLHVVTSLSEQTAQNPTVHTGMVDMQSLVAEDILETVFLTSPRSSFASAYGEQTQHNFFAQALVSLILGHKHSLSNPTFTSVLQELHRLSPFATFSFASEAVALGSVPSRLKWIPGVSGAAGAHSGDFSDIVLQARNVTRRVLTDPATRAFDAEVSADTPCVVLLNTPIPLNDPRFNEFSRDMALWMGSNFPFASSISVRGNGCAYPYHLGGKFLVQATAIYPLQPASLFPRLQSAKSVKVTPLYPVSTAIEPAANNGRVRTSEAHETDTKKPSSSSRKIKATSKRVARKTKQAK